MRVGKLAADWASLQPLMPCHFGVGSVQRMLYPHNCLCRKLGCRRHPSRATFNPRGLRLRATLLVVRSRAFVSTSLAHLRPDAEATTGDGNHVTWKSAPYCARRSFFATACEATFSHDVLYKGTAPRERTERAHPAVTSVA